MIPKQAIPPHVSALLTAREIQVLKLIVGPMCATAKEAAEALGISRRTVELHRERLGKKLKAKNIAHLARMVLCKPEDENGGQEQDRVDRRDVESDHGV
jgi:FixJ family two-component response regulator